MTEVSHGQKLAPKTAWRILVAIAIATAIMWMARILFPDFALTPIQSPVPLWVFVFYLVISIPLQEYVFRGFFLPAFLILFTRPITASLLTSVLFGVAHLPYGLAMMLATFSLSLVLCWIQLRTRNLAFAVITHWGIGLVFSMLF